MAIGFGFVFRSLWYLSPDYALLGIGCFIWCGVLIPFLIRVCLRFVPPERHNRPVSARTFWVRAIPLLVIPLLAVLLSATDMLTAVRFAFVQSEAQKAIDQLSVSPFNVLDIERPKTAFMNVQLVAAFRVEGGIAIEVLEREDPRLSHPHDGARRYIARFTHAPTNIVHDFAGRAYDVEHVRGDWYILKP